MMYILRLFIIFALCLTHKNTIMVSNFIQKNATILGAILFVIGILFCSTNTVLGASHSIVIDNQPVNHACCFDNPLTAIQESLLFKSKDNSKNKKFKVVIDAGHGGHDSGAVGKNAKEKDLTLAMALKLEKLLKKNYPDMIVLLTRSTDVFIPLFSRIQYANDENADLFISIHCNYISSPKTKGTETFVMGLHRAAENLEVAKRENASILLEYNYESNYDGYDPFSPEGHIMMSSYQNAYLEKSIEFAAEIEKQFKEFHMSKSRGVKQAGFAVLRKAAMPAVLVEAGFLSNEDEEAYLMSEAGQNTITESLTRAIAKYYEQNKDVHKELTSVDKEKEVKAAIDKVSTDNSDVKATSSVSKDVVSADALDVVYKVQIAAFKNDVADMNSAEIKSIGTLTVVRQNEVNKYLVGDFVTRASAEVAREKLKNLGYKGAFIVVLNR